MYKRICRSLFTLLLCLLFTFSAPAAAAAQTAQPCTAPSPVSSSLRRTLPVPGVYAKSGRLIKKGNKIRYKRSNGKYIRSSWKTIHGKTYYFMKNTFAVKGFQKIGGKVYYFNRSVFCRKKVSMCPGKSSGSTKTESCTPTTGYAIIQLKAKGSRLPTMPAGFSEPLTNGAAQV